MHVHVIPRVCGDIPGDLIYDMMEKADLHPSIANKNTASRGGDGLGE